MTENTSTKKFVIYDDAGFVIGHSNTRIGCYRKVAVAALGDESLWKDVRDSAKKSGSIEAISLNEETFEIAPRSDAEYVSSSAEIL